MQLDLIESLAAKDRGMKLTASANSAWIAIRLLDLNFWLREHPHHYEFKMEFFRYWCELHGFEPGDHHAWGPFTAIAVKEGIIEWTGRYAQAASKKTHAHPVKVWRAKGTA